MSCGKSFFKRDLVRMAESEGRVERMSSSSAFVPRALIPSATAPHEKVWANVTLRLSSPAKLHQESLRDAA